MVTISGVLRGARNLMFGKSIALLLTFISMAGIARLLGPKDFGILSMGLFLIGFVYHISDMGLGNAVVYYLPKLRNGEIKKLLFEVSKFRVLISILLSVILFLVSWPISNIYQMPELGLVIRLFAIGFTFYSFNLFIPSIFHGFQRFARAMIWEILNSAGKFIPLLFILLGWGLAGAVTGFVGYYILVLAISALLVWNIIPKKVKNVSFLRKCLDYGHPMFVCSVSLFATLTLLNFLIGYFRDTSEVGFFTVSYNAALFIVLGSVAMGQTLIPAISRIYKKGENYEELLQRFTKYSIYLSIPAISILIFIRERALNFVFGNEYVMGGTVFALVLLAFLLRGGISYILSNTLLGIGKVRLNRDISVSVALLCILLGVIFIPYFGVVGAGYAFLIACIFEVALFAFVFRSILNYKFYVWSLLKSAIATSVALGAVMVVSDLLFGTVILEFSLIILASISVYSLTLYLVHGFDKTDKKLIKSLLKIK